MATGGAAAEVPDSEDEPLTSSPEALPDHVADGAPNQNPTMPEQPSDTTSESLAMAPGYVNMAETQTDASFSEDAVRMRQNHDALSAATRSEQPKTDEKNSENLQQDAARVCDAKEDPPNFISPHAVDNASGSTNEQLGRPFPVCEKHQVIDSGGNITEHHDSQGGAAPATSVDSMSALVSPTTNANRTAQETGEMECSISIPVPVIEDDKIPAPGGAVPHGPSILQSGTTVEDKDIGARALNPDLSTTSASARLSSCAPSEQESPQATDAQQSSATSSLSTLPLTEEMKPTPPKSAQEITLSELKAQRAALIASLAVLPSIQDILAETEFSDTASETSDAEPTESKIMAAAHKLNRNHIKLLHEYNEIKDVGQGLMGLIADQRGVRIVEVQDEFGIESKD